MENSATITALLHAYGDGDRDALDRVVELLYDDLRSVARVQRRRGGGDLLQTTALVHELYLKIAGPSRTFTDRGHFLAACATALRHIVIDDARRRRRKKRGGDHDDLPLKEVAEPSHDNVGWLLELDRLMTELAEHDPRLVQVFECRYFAGYSSQETSEALGSPLRTVQRDWARARAWLQTALGGGARRGGNE